jgi:uncharacterized protein YciI
MFIVILTYKKPLEIVEKYLNAHRSYLDEGYRNDWLIASGPRNPRIGGILLSQLNDRSQLETFLRQDPFCINEISDYEIIEFTPVKYHPHFSKFIEGHN